tara:strand:+ start:212 stop:715 length:504 start_codon:yes stop_codon:yes gene_type:complete
MVILVSCENSEENISSFIELDNLAIEELKESDIIYTENGYLKVKVRSKKMERFNEIEERIELSGGVHFDFYKLDSTDSKSVLICDNAIINNSTNIMIANNNVVLRGDNKELKSEKLIWDKQKDLVYTESEITIQTEDEIISGVGFNSNSDFTQYEIKKAKGIFSIEK